MQRLSCVLASGSCCDLKGILNNGSNFSDWWLVIEICSMINGKNGME
jgi:hypothetical protein